VEICRQKTQILNNLASISNKYWKGSVKAVYGRINLYSFYRILLVMWLRMRLELLNNDLEN